MKAGKEPHKSDNTEKLSRFYADLKKWKSMLQFMEDEIVFIQRLLNSYIFEPNTPNLFERLQDYLQRIKRAQSAKENIQEATFRHENVLGGILECKDKDCDERYYRKHGELLTQIEEVIHDFQVLKAEIFNYAGGILKKRKP